MKDKSKLIQALSEDPFNLVLREDLANVLMAQGDFSDAEKQLQILIKQQPEREDLKNRLSLCQNFNTQESKTSGLSEPATTGSVQMRAVAPPSEMSELSNQKDNVVVLVRQRDRISFADIAGMDDLKRRVRTMIVEPFLRPGLFARFGKRAGGGILLYGPPGCGKTMLAKAISTECDAEFISVGISDILSKWHGQSEQNLRSIFQRARDQRPCVVFFDELDALAISRSKLSSDSSRTLVNEFLAQLDGMMGNNEQILFLGATNMPWDVDQAAKRPGRFSRQIFVPPPDPIAREAILNMALSSLPHRVGSLKEIIKRTELYSGAALVGLIDEAREQILEDIISTGEERELVLNDIVQALEVTSADTHDWLRTAENLVKYGGVDSSYKDLAQFLKKQKGFL